MKKVLIIAYIFPPIGGSGVQRTVKFVKYLPQFDWQPLIVCGNDGEVFNDGYDPSLLKEIPPEARIWRTRFISPINLRHWMHVKLKQTWNQTSESRSETGETGDNSAQGKAVKVFRWLSKPLSPFEFPPIDAALYWAISIIPLCLKIIRKEKVDIVYTTSFPYSDHITGCILKRITRKPWVADFRDPWTKNAAAGNTGWRRKFDSWVERRVLHSADRIISVTPTYTQEFQKSVPRNLSSKFITIENGYDQVDFEPDVLSNSSGMKNRNIVISHIGMIYDGTALPFFRAVQKLTKENQSKVSVNFIGGLPLRESKWIHENSLDWQINVTGRVSHTEAIKKMRNSDLLLLPIGSGPLWAGHYPGKLFEYMKSGTPILLISPEGDTSRLICESKTGCYAHADNIDLISSVLSSLINQREQFCDQFFHPRQDVIARYERRFLTSRLVEVFSELA